MAQRDSGGTSALRTRLRGLVEPLVTADGLFLEDLTVSRAGRRHLVRITVDGDKGVGHDELSEVSRHLSAALDEAEATDGDLGVESYTLEVSSPGVDRPLTLPRHWRRASERLVGAVLAGSKPLGRRGARARCLRRARGGPGAGGVQPARGPTTSSGRVRGDDGTGERMEDRT